MAIGFKTVFFQGLPGLVHTYAGHWLQARRFGVPMVIDWRAWRTGTISEDWGMDGGSTPEQDIRIAQAGFGAEFSFAALFIPLYFLGAYLWGMSGLCVASALQLWYIAGARMHWDAYPLKHPSGSGTGDFDDLCSRKHEHKG